MHSKWKIWDYIQQNPQGIDFNHHGIFAISSFDPLINSLIKNHFPKDHFHEQKLPVLQAKEVQLSWFEDNFATLGLFGNMESYYISQAQDLSSEIQEFLLQEDLLLDERYLILAFDKVTDFYKKLVNKDSVKGVEIQAPAFWETDKLLSYLADEMKVRLDFDSKNMILSFVEHTPIEMYNLLSKLAINFADKTISTSMLNEVLQKNRLDNFEMAKLFGFKKMKDFYQTLLDVEFDYEGLRSLFYFLQTHMIKIADPSFIQHKKRQTKYDTQIQNQSKLWKLSELDSVLTFLKEMEVMAKLKNPYLEHEIKRSYLRVIS